MAKSDNGFLVFHDWKVLFTHTPAEDCKQILLAMFEYSERGEEPPRFEGIAEMTASVIFPAMKRHKEKVEFGRKGGLASAQRAVSEGTTEDAIKPTTDNKTRKDKIKQDKDYSLLQESLEPQAALAPSLQKRAAKKAFGEFGNVKLTDDEYSKLCAEHQDTDEAIAYLDAYIAEKGCKSKSHYLTIKRWVFDALEEQRNRAAKNTQRNSTDLARQSANDYLEAVLRGEL